jgi:hypothetical protein
MDQDLKENKQTIRAFMREHYTDERLAMLLAHAQSGRLAYMSCCCFIGIPTADHALQGESGGIYSTTRHYIRAAILPLAREAESAYCNLAECEGDQQRIRRLIPIIKAEMRRRERLRITQDSASLTLSAPLSSDTEVGSLQH